MTEDPQSETPKPSGPNSFWAELKRRKVMRVGITYAVVAWAAIQVSGTVFPQLGIPDWAARLVTLILLIGFPIALIITWAQLAIEYRVWWGTLGANQSRSGASGQG